MSRKNDLESWKKNRRVEIFLDVCGHAMRVLPAFFLVEWLVPEGQRRPYVVVLLLVLYVSSCVIVWLRIEGAYIERRLNELEALLTNERPVYYSGEVVDYENNPLYQRLNELEEEVRRLAGH